MSNMFHKSFMALSAGAFILAAGATTMTVTSVAPAMAQDDDEEENANRSLSRNVAEDVQEAYIEASENENYAQAIAIIDRLIQQRGGSMTPYESATVYSLRAQFRAGLDNPDYSLILQDLERAVSFGALGADQERQIRFSMAQIYFQEERYDDAIRLLTEYIQYQESIGETINANTYRLLAGAYVNQDKFQQARRPMETALRLSRQEGDPDKSYYAVMNYIYSELSLQSERGELLEEMINIWPEESDYWAQLAGIYSGLDRQQDAAAVLELGYRAGIITEEAKIISLIQYFTNLENPYRAATLLEQEMAAGNIERTQENLELLAQAYNLAREQKRALEPLSEAAQMAPTGELYYRLGQIYFADEQWEQAISSLRQAINRGGIDSDDVGDAWLLIGNAQYNIDTNSPEQRRQAMDAWRRATNYSSSRRTASGWISYLEQVIATERRQDQVEQAQRQEAYRAERRRCQTNVEIYERLGAGSDMTEDDVARCRRILESRWENNQIVFPNGDTAASVQDV